jgi:hypothetical protein
MRSHLILFALVSTTSAFAAVAPVKPTVQIADDPLVSLGNNTVAVLPLVPFAPDLHVAEGVETFAASESWSDSYGNSRFGASLDISSSVEAFGIAGIDGISASVDLSATATLFGRDETVAHIGGRVARSASGATVYGATLTREVEIMGSAVTLSAASANSTASDDWTRNFFHKSETFMVGPVPLTVEGSVDGTVGISHTSSAPSGDFSVDLTMTPFAGLDADVALGVGVRGVLAAGVSGHLNVLDVEVPTSASIDQALRIDSGRTLDWALESDVDVTTMSGSISLWAELLWARYSRRIANWSGDHDTFGLFFDDGRVCLGDACLGM